ncbi:MAG: DUF1848 family protein [Spirochaetales bacterium]|nr:DUF1848 family protein [Spirochaetales bacterium]
MIISASRRTDIPRFYSEWLRTELQKGRLISENPFNPAQKKIIPLGEVHQFVFWTRYAPQVFPVLDILDSKDICYSFLFTITSYPDWLETNRPGETAISNFRVLSERIGPDKIHWRYDPVLFTTNLDTEWHIREFDDLCRKLHRHTNKVIISLFDDKYPAARSRMKQAETHLGSSLSGFPDRLSELLGLFLTISRQYGLSIQACADERITSSSAIPAAPCISDTRSSGQLPLFDGMSAAGKGNGQRKQCLCAKSYDIGTYNSCQGGCLYCYALKSKKPVVQL